jgi:hypothetical protein
MARRVMTGHLAKGCQAALRSSAGSQPVSATWRSAMTASSPFLALVHAGAKHVGEWSTTRIGRFYNGRDHSNVCHAVKRIETP